MEAPQRVAVIERNALRTEALFAFGIQLYPDEARDPRGVVLRGGVPFDACCEGSQIGPVGTPEEGAAGGVEQCGMLLDIAGPPAGEVDDLV